MNKLYNISVDEYLEIIEIAKEIGKKPGDNISDVFNAYVELKNIKPIGSTELTKKELIEEYLSHGKKILEIDVNSEGNSEFKLHKNIDKHE